MSRIVVPAPRPLGRRRLLQGCAALCAWPLLARAAGPRVAAVSLDWGLSESLFAMGLAPLGASALHDYARTPGQAPIPPGVVDVGLSSSPNLELLQSLAPSLLLVQSWQESLRPQLERIAPVHAFTLYTGDGHPLQRALDASRELGRLLGQPERGAALAQAGEARLQVLRERLDAQRGMPVCLLQQIDGDHLSVFAAGGLFHDVLERLGLRNAWQGPADLLWGGSQINLGQLAAVAAERVLIIDGQRRNGGLYASELWRQLPLVRAGRVAYLPFVWGFGALPSALRFAELLSAALLGEAPA